MGLGTLWATSRESIPHEVRNAKRVETNAPQAWAPMRGTLFGVGPCRGGLFELNGPPPAGGVGSYNHHCNGEEDGVEASVVVCEPLKPPRLCHTENQPEVRKTATQKRARGARAVLRAVRAVRLFPSWP